MLLISIPPHISAYTPHAPIFIDGDGAFNASNGVTGGNGTQADPWIIEAWEVNASGGPGVRVWNTDDYFVVRGIYVHSGGGLFTGVSLWNVSHGALENSTLSGNAYGLSLDLSDNVTVSANTVAGNVWGINVQGVIDSTFLANTVSGNGFGLRLGGSSNVTVAGNTFLGNANFGVLLDASVAIALTGNIFAGEGIVLMSYGLGPADPPYYDSHTITTDNLVNGDPVVYLANCGNATVDGVPVGQLLVASCANVRAANLQIANTSAAVQMIHVQDVLLDTVALSANNEGVYLAFVGNATLQGTEVNGSDGGTSYTYGHGVILWSVSQATFRDTRVLSSTFDGVHVEDTLSAVTFDNATISDNGGDGVWFGASAGDLTVVNSTFSGNAWSGLGATGFADAAITGSTFAGNTYGLSLPCVSAPVVIENNTVSGNVVDGITVSCAVGGRIANNLLTGNERGILVYSADSAVISGNQLEGSNSLGIFVVGSTNVSISGNGVSSVLGGPGIYVNGSAGVTVTGNNLSANSLGLYVSSTSDLLAHHNMLLGNGVQAMDLFGGANAWDDGYPGGGNYWSDYNGTDLCSGPAQTNCSGADGIGDTPYVIDGDTQDRYPLMSPGGTGDLPPSVVVTCPVGGESWTGGTVHVLCWTASDPDDSLLSWWVNSSLDGGAVWAPVSSSGPDVVGSASYPWAVPAADTLDAWIEVCVSDGLRSDCDAAGPFEVDSTDPVPSPSPNGTTAPPDAPLTVDFDEDVNSAPPTAADVLITPDPGGISLNWMSPRRVVISHAPFAPGTPYTWGLSCSFTDDSDPGNPVAGCGTEGFAFTAAPPNDAPYITDMQVEGFALPPEITHLTTGSPDLAWTYQDNESDSMVAFTLETWEGASLLWNSIENRSAPAGAIVGTVYGGPPLAPGSCYTGVLRVSDGIWSAPASLGFCRNSRPLVPGGFSPPDNATGVVPGVVTLDWSDVADGEGDPVEYDYCVGRGAVPPCDVASGRTTSSSVDLSLIGGESYCWQVRADDGWELSAWSPVVCFTTAAIPLPPSVSVASPVAGAVVRGGQTAWVSWSVADPDTALANLTFYVNFTSSAVAGPLAGPLAGVTGFAWDVPWANVTDAVLNVTVIDETGLRDWADSGTFAIDSAAPRLALYGPRGWDVALDARVDALFDEPVSAMLNFTAESFGLRDESLPRWVEVSWIRVPSSLFLQEFHFVPTSPLEPCTTYRVFLNGTFFDRAQHYLSPVSWTFGTLCPPVLQLLSPLGGEVWTPGTVAEVRWNASDGGASDLTAWVNYSLDGGADGFPRPVFEGVVAEGVSSAPWILSAVNSTAVRVRVTVADLAGLTASVESANFTVRPFPPLPPLAVARVPAQAIAGEEVTLDGAGSTGNITRYVWVLKTADGRVLAEREGAVVTFAFPESGQYRVVLSVYDDATGLQDSETVEVNVALEPPSPAGRVELPILAGLAAALLLAGLLAWEPSRVAFLTLVLAPGSRRRYEDGEDPETRGMIRGYLRVHPGDTYAELQRNLGLNHGALTWHLAKLEKEGVIKSRIRDGRKRYYPASVPLHPEDGSELYDVQRELLRAAGEEPGLPVSVLAAKVGVSSQLALYHLRKLAQKGYARLDRRGFRLRAFPARELPPSPPAEPPSPPPPQ